MNNLKTSLRPVGKYVNNGGKEGIRYIWEIDNNKSYYVESGSFYKRTNLGINKIDEQIAAYTTSVSAGCILSLSGEQCKFCVTGNEIPFRRLLSAEEIALQNVFMVINDTKANKSGKMREFAYMGQGEPGLSYENVKKAILITNNAMRTLGIKVYRHIFATSGVVTAVDSLTKDFNSGVFGGVEILLHLSIHAITKRGELMPINNKFPLKNLFFSSKKYAIATGRKVVINLMMLRNVNFGESGPFTTVTFKESQLLIKMLDPRYHRIIICEYNRPGDDAIANEVDLDEVNKAEKNFLDNGFEVKKFVAFGKKDKLACGLLGGEGKANIHFSEIQDDFDKALDIIHQFKSY